MQAGTKFLVDYFAEVDLKHLDIRSDYDDSVAVPDLGDNPVPSKYRSFIPYFPNWVTLPDYFRVRHIVLAMRDCKLATFIIAVLKNWQ